MDAVACYDVSLAAENEGRAFSHVHQIEQVEPAALAIEKQVDVGIRTRVAARVEPNKYKCRMPSSLSSASCVFSLVMTSVRSTPVT